MRNLTPAFILCWLMVNNVAVLHAGVGTLVQVEENPDPSTEHTQKEALPSRPSMRVEEPDGTMRPLIQDALPESRMSTEGLEEVPDAGGGAMVNVEGRFKSILQLPEGSDQAVHKDASEDSPQHNRENFRK